MPDLVEGRWILDRRKSLGMTLGSIVLTVAGLFLFGGLSSMLGSAGDMKFEMTPQQAESGRAFQILILLLVGVVVLYAFILLFHEACHFAAARFVGGRPRFGAKFVTWFFPVLYVTAPGFWMSRKQYLIFAMTPTVVVNVLGTLLMLPPWPGRVFLILPMALHLGGCIGDWWMTCTILLKPRDTQFEDTPEGFNFRRMRSETPKKEDAAV
jgi:hypothetical protein